ncbi:MAG: trypsin-like peptidase domain-containing protein, partial [Actinobacteria bacterium]|nr:trypsin-like peptidase domain-containing protein [Actinomycetota bacterium]
MPRAAVYAVVSLVSAIAGAALVLGIGKGAGWIDSRTRTVVVDTRPPPEEQTAVQPQPAPLPRSFNPESIYAKRSAGVVTLFSSFPTGDQGQGSGFVVSSEGYVLTNAHVITTAPDQPVERATRVYVEFSNGDRVDGEIVGYDLFSDVGLVKVDPGGHRLTPLPLGSSATVVVGEPVAAIGSPFGNETSLSVGVVSATRRSISSVTSEYELTDAIQTDAAINHGNSGGPLLDGRGRVIGINAQIRSTTGAGEGVGFAVPIDTARRSMRELLADGKVRYAYVGITTDDLTPALARFLEVPVSTGALVTCVNPGSPGERAGLHGGTQHLSYEGAQVTGGGDVILTIDGNAVRSGSDVVRAVGQGLEPGQKAVFTVLRGSDRKKISVTLGE